MIELIHVDEEELALLRADPLLCEQELDVRPEVARSLERATGRRRGRVYWRSRHDHLYALELADLGREIPAMATVFGLWDRFEPRPPEHEIDGDLADFCLWVADVGEGMEIDDVRRVFEFAGIDGGWPAGSVVRPEEGRFTGLPDFPWPARFVEVEGLRMAYVESGGGDETFLLLHGEPTWGYLYRHMVPILGEVGRVVVPDLVGFGRSDKPVAVNAYSYRAHQRWLRGFIESLDLRDVTLVCQDWGGLLGLRLLAEQPRRFRRLVAMNTGLPSGDDPPTEAFLRWRRFTQRVERLDVPRLMRQAVRRDGFTDAEAAAYGAPLAGDDEQAGALAFPRLVPIRPDHPGALESRRATAVLAALDLPVFLPWGAEDPITSPWREDLERLFPQAEGLVVDGAGHFLPEDAGELVAERVRSWIGRSPARNGA